MATVTVTLQFIAGPRHTTELPSRCSVKDVARAAEEAFGALAAEGIRVVLRGAALPLDKPAQLVALKEGDHLLVAPQRKAPPAELVAAVTRAAAQGAPGGGGGAGDDDEDEERTALPPGAPRWEAAVVELLRTRARCPDWVLEWVVLIRPSRLLAFLIFMAGCVVSSRIGLGPVFVLCGMLYFIFTNLGRRREGEVSAYSIFNRGVRRLPGQLDADEVDRQIRQGHM